MHAHAHTHTHTHTHTHGPAEPASCPATTARPHTPPPSSQLVKQGGPRPREPSGKAQGHGSQQVPKKCQQRPILTAAPRSERRGRKRGHCEEKQGCSLGEPVEGARACGPARSQHSSFPAGRSRGGSSVRGNDTPDPQIRAPDTRSERLHLRASGARAPGPRLRQARGCRSAPGRPQQSQRQSRGGWAASKAYTAGVPCPYTNSTADSERQRSQLSLAPVSITPPFRAGAKRFYQNVQRPVVPAVTPQLPSGDPVSPGWTPSEPHQPSRGLGERRPQRWPRAYTTPPLTHRVGPGDLHRVRNAMGRVAGLGGPPRLRHRLRGPRHGGERLGALGPQQSPSRWPPRLKASPPHLLTGRPVTGT